MRKNAHKEVAQDVVGVNICVGSTRLCLEVRAGAVPAFVVEMELLERMPKPIRDRINDMSLGLAFETVCQVYILWEQRGVAAVLLALDEMERKVKHHQVSRGLEIR